MKYPKSWWKWSYRIADGLQKCWCQEQFHWKSMLICKIRGMKSFEIRFSHGRNKRNENGVVKAEGVNFATGHSTSLRASTRTASHKHSQKGHKLWAWLNHCIIKSWIFEGLQNFELKAWFWYLKSSWCCLKNSEWCLLRRNYIKQVP